MRKKLLQLMREYVVQTNRVNWHTALTAYWWLL